MQFETLQKAMIAAMKAREKERKEAISVLVSATKKLAIDEGCREDIPEELVDRAILKEIKYARMQSPHLFPQQRKLRLMRDAEMTSKKNW